MDFKFNLVQFVVGRLIFSGEIKEQLFHVPVEEGIEIGLKCQIHCKSTSAEGCLISIQLLKYEQRGHETLPGGRK